MARPETGRRSNGTAGRRVQIDQLGFARAATRLRRLTFSFNPPEKRRDYLRSLPRMNDTNSAVRMAPPAAAIMVARTG